MIEFILIYLIFINVLASVLTVYDKISAIKKRHRIPERILLFIGIIGGAFFEYLTMRIIHHKTLHRKFMITLPLLILLHLFIILLIFVYL